MSDLNNISLILLLKVITDDEGKATIPSTVTREIRLFGEDSAIGKMVVLESSSKGEVEGCGVIQGPIVKKQVFPENLFSVREKIFGKSYSL